jgi:putative acetyltransferase
MADFIIREEIASDKLAIRRITEAAFKDKPYAGGDEQDVIDRLRDSGALCLSLVMSDGDKVVGQISFSPATFSDGSEPWFALGPVSVLPSRQGLGLGSSLINEGLTRINDMGALGCILTGNPEYYLRFGFELAAVNVPSNEQAEYFMLNLLGGDKAQGTFAFHKAFYGEA